MEKRLIIHVDDLGEPSANAATEKLAELGVVSSGSVMAPMVHSRCDRNQVIADLQRLRTKLDLGVHITLNSEVATGGWPPLTPAPSLRDSRGLFPKTFAEVVRVGDTYEIAQEIAEQVTICQNWGLEPSHVDTHMATILAKPEWLQCYLDLAGQHRLRPMLPKHTAEVAGFAKLKGLDPAILPMVADLERLGESTHLPLLDRLILDVSGSKPFETQEERAVHYLQAIASIKPGVTQMIVHLSSHPDFHVTGVASARERRRYWDYQILQSPTFRTALQDHDIKLVDWSNAWPNSQGARAARKTSP